MDRSHVICIRNTYKVATIQTQLGPAISEELTDAAIISLNVRPLRYGLSDWSKFPFQAYRAVPTASETLELGCGVLWEQTPSSKSTISRRGNVLVEPLLADGMSGRGFVQMLGTLSTLGRSYTLLITLRTGSLEAVQPDTRPT